MLAIWDDTIEFVGVTDFVFISTDRGCLRVPR